MGSFADLVQMEWLSSTDWISVAFTALQWLIACAILIVLVNYLILRPKRYPYHILIKDITGGGLRILRTRGGWVIDKKDGTGSFKLMNDKLAMLKMPDKYSSLTTKHGRVAFELLKYGPGSFDYAVLNYSHITEKENHPRIISLADEDWAKLSVKKAVEKKTLGSWWAENKSTVITVTAIVISMIIVGGAVQMAGDQARLTISSADKMLEQYESISENLRYVAEALGAELPEVVPPPPSS